MVGQELYVIVVDPQTGIATARQLDGVDDLLDEETEERFADRLNPLSACAISFFLFMGCSLLLSHLFHSLPEPSPGMTQCTALPCIACNKGAGCFKMGRESAFLNSMRRLLRALGCNISRHFVVR